MARCVGNIRRPTKNYENLIISVQVRIENVRDVFWDTVYTYAIHTMRRRRDSTQLNCWCEHSSRVVIFFHKNPPTRFEFVAREFLHSVRK